MAKLIDLMPQIKETPIVKDEVKSESSGKKRRAWLQNDEETKGVYEPNLSTPIQKGVMNTVDQSGGSTPLDKGVMNRVYKPLINSLDDLRGNPLSLAYFLYQITGYPDELSTRRVTIKEMMENLIISKDSARTALRFLLKNKLIERLEFKDGRLGWSRYKIKESLRNEIAEKGSIDRIKRGSNSSSSLLNTITNNINPLFDVDVSPLAHIGFTPSHLLQLKGRCNPEIIQTSVNHFSYALQYNAKAKEYKNPLATIMAVLKRGDVWLEAGYKSPQELAMDKILERKKAELERQKELEEQCFEVALKEWLMKLQEKEIEEIAPKKSKDFTPQKAKLSAYFKEKHWPNIKKEFGIV